MGTWAQDGLRRGPKLSPEREGAGVQAAHRRIGGPVARGEAGVLGTAEGRYLLAAGNARSPHPVSWRRDDPQGRVVKLHYIHDPMCSWCWAFAPAWREIRARLPSRIATERVLCGLAPDTREPMPEAMRQYIQGTWRRIEREVPGTRFNYGFWARCRPRRSTYPACRAVIAAISRGAEFEEPMIEGIQRAYYLEARNPSDDETLIALAEATGLERERFTLDLNSAATQAELGRQIRFAARLCARGSPSLILTAGGEARPIAYDYRDPAVVLEQLGL